MCRLRRFVRFEVVLRDQGIKSRRRRSTLRYHDCGTVCLQEVTTRDSQAGIARGYREGPLTEQNVRNRVATGIDVADGSAYGDRHPARIDTDLARASTEDGVR